MLDFFLKDFHKSRGVIEIGIIAHRIITGDSVLLLVCKDALDRRIALDNVQNDHPLCRCSESIISLLFDKKQTES